MSDPKYIIVSRGFFLDRSEIDGKIISSGLVGVIGRGDIYLTVYAKYNDWDKRIDELEVGERIEAEFTLCGGYSLCDVVRVS